MSFKRTGSMRYGELAWLTLAAFSPLVIWAMSIATDGSVVHLSRKTLSEVSGGALGDCCVKGSLGCGGGGGCNGSTNKCTGPDDCPVANEELKKNLKSMYQKASCFWAAGSLGTINLAQIVCYNTETCPQTCTEKAFYWYCDAGINPQPGPNVTPTAPDNTVCPP